MNVLFTRMRFLLILPLFLCISYACKCQTQTTHEAFCKAEWVSHLKVKVRITKQPLPDGSSRKGLNNLRYGVEHVKIYKKPSNLTSLPTEVFTPSESPACGLIIDTGKEYLLAGRFDGSVLYTVLCGQVLPDDTTENIFENVLEWKKVPVGFEKKLDSIKC